MSANGAGSGGVGFCGLLTVLFIGLKLTHYIDWSWWWVVSPLWIGAVVTLTFMALMVVLVCLAGLIAALLGR